MRIPTVEGSAMVGDALGGEANEIDVKRRVVDRLGRSRFGPKFDESEDRRRQRGEK
jgi:hypothetical protein